MAAGTIAAIDWCLAATIEYTSQRKAFGKSILDNQYVHYKLAELQTEVRFLWVLGVLATLHVNVQSWVFNCQGCYLSKKGGLYLQNWEVKWVFAAKYLIFPVQNKVL